MAKDIINRKILVLGVDGADPRLTRTYLDQGLLPNTAELLRKSMQKKISQKKMVSVLLS
ncbi:MAG: hypothetical protein IJ936_05140 [Peptococcaceae bacterium]|nr:hypothetical protein [Peptococcaceae bacterium]